MKKKEKFRELTHRNFKKSLIKCKLNLNKTIKQNQAAIKSWLSKKTTMVSLPERWRILKVRSKVLQKGLKKRDENFSKVNWNWRFDALFFFFFKSDGLLSLHHIIFYSANFYFRSIFLAKGVFLIPFIIINLQHTHIQSTVKYKEWLSNPSIPKYHFKLILASNINLIHTT